MFANPTVDTACPKCGHVRTPVDMAPDWQCPRCGIAYHKYRARLRRNINIAPRQVSRGLPTLTHDVSAWLLLGANAVALVMALALNWQLVDLMAVYWLQSVVIGSSYWGRIMNLEKFSTENFRINNRAVEPTLATKRKTAAFFVLHYGGFHAGYLIFIFTQTHGGFAFGWGCIVSGLAFAVNHLFSYRYYLSLDRQGTPNIGTLMFTPYLRIIPMHLMIVFGALSFESPGIVLFGLLKTVADVVMHLIEHRTLGAVSLSV